MGKRKKIDGVLLLDKPADISSNQALQQARWLYQAEKAGHGGTLDPFATGLLPVLFGEASKFGRYFLDGDKAYEATLAFGTETDTGDLSGAVIREAAPPPLDAVDWVALCARFSGVQRQVPPVYSALKVGGERAYALARRGELPQLEAREVVIHELRFLGMDGDGARFFVRCSKGTYIRSLLRDMAAALGSAGHTHALRRVAVAGLAAMTPLATLRAWQEAGDMAALQALLLPLDCCVAHLPRVVVPPEKLRFIRNGTRRAGVPAAAVRVAASMIYSDTRKVLCKARRRRQYAVVRRGGATPYRALRGWLYAYRVALVVYVNGFDGRRLCGVFVCFSFCFLALRRLRQSAMRARLTTRQPGQCWPMCWKIRRSARY